MAARAAAYSGPWRLALAGPSAASLLHLRDDLIRDVTARGHHVLCITPPGPEDDARALRELDVQHRVISLDPTGPKFVSTWKVVSAYVDAFRDWQPHVVMGIGARPLVNAALAARRLAVRRVVSLVNGLPPEGSGLGVEPRRLARALGASDAVVFHNDEDRHRLEVEGILPPGQPAVVVAGAGVNLERHAVQPLPPTEAGLVFLMISRLERSRGVVDYARAAETVKTRAPGARFLLAGAPGTASDAITAQSLAALGGAVEYLGPLPDVREALASCHVFVYPSHHEGMPRAVLEALATGRPVITTDAPGCRETVDDKVSGCLVPVGDVTALAAAMESFIRNPGLLPATAKAARLKAERRFDVVEVNRVLLDLLGLA